MAVLNKNHILLCLSCVGATKRLTVREVLIPHPHNASIITLWKQVRGW